jgi:hypothetical protein
MMQKEVLFSVEDVQEGGYVARALGHSIFTQADTWEELKEAIRDAVLCHFGPEEQPRLICLQSTSVRYLEHFKSVDEDEWEALQ